MECQTEQDRRKIIPKQHDHILEHQRKIKKIIIKKASELEQRKKRLPTQKQHSD